MMFGNGLRSKSLNKTQVIIHKMPLFDRILGWFSSIVLTLFIIVSLYMGYEKRLEMIALFFTSLFFCFLMYLSAFKTFICFDVDQKIITIQNGLKKEVLSTTNMIEIKVVDNPKHKCLFSLNYCFLSHTKKDYSWSTGPSSRVLFGSTRTQKKRLEQFCDKCNDYLTKSN